MEQAMSEVADRAPEPAAASTGSVPEASSNRQVSPRRLLHYRPWSGQFLHPAWSVWPVCRAALGLILRRKIFWGLYALALLIFLMFFFGQYLLAWAESQMGEDSVSVVGFRMRPGELMEKIRGPLKLNGNEETYSLFFRWQGSMLVILLALTGSLVIGNDFQHGSLAFYLSKPLGPWHYLAGKFLAVGVIVNLMTTLPAVILFFQYRFLYEWRNWADELRLLAGIVGYGQVLTVAFSLLLLATATWLRKTIPMIMAWTTLFFFFRFLAGALVDLLHYDARWRLIDLWNDAVLVGNYCLGMAAEKVRPLPQPAWYEAAFVLGALCVLCLSYLSLRIRAVEIVR
jgi:hypothetical protein